MSDAAMFVLVFGGLFVLRGIAATVVFMWILPDGIRCPQCDAETTRVESSGVLRLLTGFRSSWCLVCGWHGVHRIDAAAPTAPTSGSHAGAPSGPTTRKR
jgi:hypothetical protein